MDDPLAAKKPDKELLMVSSIAIFQFSLLCYHFILLEVASYASESVPNYCM